MACTLLQHFISMVLPDSCTASIPPAFSPPQHIFQTYAPNSYQRANTTRFCDIPEKRIAIPPPQLSLLPDPHRPSPRTVQRRSAKPKPHTPKLNPPPPRPSPFTVGKHSPSSSPLNRASASFGISANPRNPRPNPPPPPPPPSFSPVGKKSPSSSIISPIASFGSSANPQVPHGRCPSSGQMAWQAEWCDKQRQQSQEA